MEQQMEQFYPKWMYHRTLPPVLVQDPDEQAALGDKWAVTPAAFLEPEVEPDCDPDEPYRQEEPAKKRGHK
jgi:hypothetical protein